MTNQDYDYTKCRIKTVKPLRSTAKTHPWKLEAGTMSYFGYKDADGEIWFGFVNGVYFALSSVLGPGKADLQLIRPGEGVLGDLPYRPPFQVPLYWKYEESGILEEAILAFLDCGLEGRSELRPEYFGLVKEYLEYYINAPCWTGPFQEEVSELREWIKKVDNVTKVKAWIYRCLDIGLDPL